jgi:hypothetical protein
MKKIKMRTWLVLIMIVVLVVVVYNRYKYNPLDDYSLGTLNQGYDPDVVPMA